MAVDGLQAATLMVAGLAEIDQAFNVFGVPFFFESDAELVHVQQKLTPLIQERLRAGHYHLIGVLLITYLPWLTTGFLP